MQIFRCWNLLKTLQRTIIYSKHVEHVYSFLRQVLYTYITSIFRKAPKIFSKSKSTSISSILYSKKMISGMTASVIFKGDGNFFEQKSSSFFCCNQFEDTLAESWWRNIPSDIYSSTGHQSLLLLTTQRLFRRIKVSFSESSMMSLVRLLP